MSKFLSPFANNLSQPPPQDKYRKTIKSLNFPRKDVLQKHFSLWAGGQGCERPTTGAFEHSHADLSSPSDLLSTKTPVQRAYMPHHPGFSHNIKANQMEAK